MLFSCCVSVYARINTHGVAIGGVEISPCLFFWIGDLRLLAPTRDERRKGRVERRERQALLWLPEAEQAGKQGSAVRMHAGPGQRGAQVEAAATIF